MIVVEIRRSNLMTHFVTDHTDAQRLLKVEDDAVHILAVDSMKRGTAGVAGWPQQISPGIGWAAYDQSHPIHPAVVVHIDIQVIRHHRVQLVHHIFKQLAFTGPALSLGIADVIHVFYVGRKIASFPRHQDGNYLAASVGTGIEKAVYRQLPTGDLVVIILQRRGIHEVKHIAVLAVGL